MLQEESEKEQNENSAAATCKLSCKEAVSDVISLAYFKVMGIYYRYIQYIL